MKKVTLNSIKMLMIQISAFMMAFAPVADGYAAQKNAQELNEARIKEILIGMGATKPQTIGSFYSKNKSQFPPRIQKILGELVENHKNEKMPVIEVASAKGADGKIVPLVRVQAPGHIFNIEVHNNDKYFAKVGPTELTNIDINNFTDAIEKMYHNDYQFRRWVESQKKSVSTQSLGMSVSTTNAVKNEFSLPEINAELWKKMTPEGRVQYILNMRNMWKDAKAVLANRPGQKRKSKSKKTSSLDVMEEIWNLMNADAEAASLATGIERRAGGPVPGTTGTVNYNNACLIAGWAVEYKGRSTTCDQSDVKKRYSGDIFDKAHSDCGDSQIACNPMIYGTPEGRTLCVKIDTTAKSDFQVATHYNGPCERGFQGIDSQRDNRLSSEIKFLKEDGDKAKNKNRYGKDNELLNPDQLKEEIRKEQERSNYGQTKYFLDGVMKSRYPLLVDMFNKGEINKDVFDALSKIKQGFDSQIEEARKACKSSALSGRKQETNFWGACDQLQRREIFLSGYLEKNVGCKNDAVYDRDSMKCKCTAQFKSVIVYPGQSCGDDTTTCQNRNSDGTCADPISCGQNGRDANGTCIQDPEQACKKVGFETGKAIDGSPKMIMCSCKNASVNVPLANATKEIAKQKCSPAGVAPGGPPATTPPAADDGGSCSEAKRTACESEIDGKKGNWSEALGERGARACSCDRGPKKEESSHWKDNKETYIMAGIGLVAIAAFVNSAPKKPRINSPGDPCAGGGQVICTGVCPKVNQVKINGVCQCRQPNQYEQLIDAVECTYAGLSTGDIAQEVRCPDGVTLKPLLTECPMQTCSDGTTKVYIGQTCAPETPPSKPTSTDTSEVKK